MGSRKVDQVTERRYGATHVGIRIRVAVHRESSCKVTKRTLSDARIEMKDPLLGSVDW